MSFWDALGDGMVRMMSNKLDNYGSVLKDAERQYRDDPVASAHLAEKRREYEDTVEDFKDRAERYYEKRDERNNGSDDDDY